MAKRLDIPAKNTGNDANSRVTPTEFNQVVDSINRLGEDVDGAVGGFQGNIAPTDNFIPANNPKGSYNPTVAGARYGPTDNKYLLVPENPDINGDSYVHNVINDGLKISLNSVKIPTGDFARNGGSNKTLQAVDSVSQTVKAAIDFLTGNNPDILKNMPLTSASRFDNGEIQGAAGWKRVTELVPCAPNTKYRLEEIASARLGCFFSSIMGGAANFIDNIAPTHPGSYYRTYEFTTPADCYAMGINIQSAAYSGPEITAPKLYAVASVAKSALDVQTEEEPITELVTAIVNGYVGGSGEIDTGSGAPVEQWRRTEPMKVEGSTDYIINASSDFVPDTNKNFNFYDAEMKFLVNFKVLSIPLTVTSPKGAAFAIGTAKGPNDAVVPTLFSVKRATAKSRVVSFFGSTAFGPDIDLTGYAHSGGSTKTLQKVDSESQSVIKVVDFITGKEENILADVPLTADSRFNNGSISNLSGWKRTAIIPCDPSTKYRLKDIAAIRLGSFYTDIAGGLQNYINDVAPTHQTYYTEYEFTTPADCYAMGLNVLSPDTGQEVTDPKLFKVATIARQAIDIVIEEEPITELVGTIVPGYVGGSGEIDTGSGAPVEQWRRTEPMKVEGSTDYIINASSDFVPGTNKNFNFYDAEMKFLVNFKVLSVPATIISPPKAALAIGTVKGPNDPAAPAMFSVKRTYPKSKVKSLYGATHFGEDNGISPEDVYKKAYVSYDPTGESGREKFTAYVRVNGNVYAGFVISRYYRPPGSYGDGQNSDQFRLMNAAFYRFNGVDMAPMDISILSDGESESALVENGKGPTGGFHGNELLTQVNFFIDGVDMGPVEDMDAFELRPCTNFKYVQVSDMYRFQEGVTVIFRRTKETICSEGKLTTENLYTPPNDIDFALYGSLVCVAPACSQFAQNDMGEIRNMQHAAGNSETHFMEVYGGNKIRYWSNSNGASVDVSGTIVRHRKLVSGNSYEDGAETLNASARVTTKDNSRYGKYYRVNTNVNLKAGDFIKCRTEINITNTGI